MLEHPLRDGSRCRREKAGGRVLPALLVRETPARLCSSVVFAKRLCLICDGAFDSSVPAAQPTCRLLI